MHSLTLLIKKKTAKKPKTSACLFSHTLSSMATAFVEFQTVASCKGRSEEKTFKRPTFRSQAKCLWKSISHSILQAHRTAATSLLTATDKAASAAHCRKQTPTTADEQKGGSSELFVPWNSCGPFAPLLTLHAAFALGAEKDLRVVFGVWAA